MYQSGRAGDEAKKHKSSAKSGRVGITALRGGEWYLEKRGPQKIWAKDLEIYLKSVFDQSRSLILAWFVLRFLSLETFYQRVSRSDF